MAVGFIRQWINLAGVLACLVLALACSGLKPRSDPFVKDLVILEARQAQGYYREALALAEGLMPMARTPEEQCKVTLVLARSRAGLGMHRGALDTFARLPDVCGDDPMISAKGLYEMGVWVAQSSPGECNPLDIFRAVVTRFPDEPAAKRSVVWIRDILKNRGPVADVVAELQTLYGEVARSAVGPNLAFEAALLLEGLGGDGPAQALSLYSLVVRRHPDSGLVDDALFESARISMNLGYHWDAVGFLKTIMKRRETSLLFGSYDSAMYPKAAFLLAETTFLATGDPEDAVDHYRRFISTYKESSRRDDAWFRIYEIRKEEGRIDEARAVLHVLVNEFPLSGKGRAAKRLLEETE